MIISEKDIYDALGLQDPFDYQRDIMHSMMGWTNLADDVMTFQLKNLLLFRRTGKSTRRYVRALYHLYNDLEDAKIGQNLLARNKRINRVCFITKNAAQKKYAEEYIYKYSLILNEKYNKTIDIKKDKNIVFITEDDHHNSRGVISYEYMIITDLI